MEWAKKWGVIIVPGMIGLVVLVYGLWQIVKPQEPVVEIVKGTENKNTEYGEVFVDVAGEVQKPGVYKLPIGGRIGDALVAAGGLSAQADRDWVSQNLNLAKEIRDGEKIYIPANQRTRLPDGQVSQSDSQIVGKPATSESQKDGKVNINTASQEELETLWGIGEARAKTIITSRPYGSSGELVSKAKIPQSVYDKISSQITVY